MTAYRRSTIEILLYPAMQLMRRLRFPAKTALMGLLLIVPLSWLTGQALFASYGSLEATRLEAAGAPLIAQMLELTAQTQKHRGLVNRSQAGDTTVASALSESRAALEAATRAVDSTLARETVFDLAKAWTPIQTGIKQVLEMERNANSFKAHSDLIEQQRVFLSRCAEASGLLLDPEAATFHMMHLAVEPVIAWTEALGQLRGRGAAVIRKGEMGLADSGHMAAQVQLLRQAAANARFIAGALERAGEKVPDALQRALDSSRAYDDLVEATFSVSAPKGDAAVFFDAGTKAIADVVMVGKSTADRLQELLNERADQLRAQWIKQLAVGVGTVLMIAYLSAAFFRTSFGAVRVLQGAVVLLAGGDFSTKVKLRGTDELSVVANTLDGMTGRLSEMIADIRSNSTLVAQAGFQLSDATKSLSDRTVSQAASLEETGANLQELGAAVRANAAGAEAASSRAATVSDIAQEGGSAIQSAVASMRDIQTSSARVQEIVGVIEGIAFQTNILALNAAVEAARAGEQGRGFAVVASEVRSLAQRSASSAKEIKTLIAASADNVAIGVKQIDGASVTFDQIVGGIREVAESLQVIRTNTSEQSMGLDQISVAVKQIDEITQQNSQMVDLAFRHSSELTDRADKLAQAVESFKLRQGSADEAAALVRKASALLKSGGASALAQISSSGGGFADRDMYVFAFDRQGVYRAFGDNPAKVGSLVSANPGVNAQRLVSDAFDQAERGGGWVDYEIANPLTGHVDAKTSYVEPAGTDLVLGCGVYKARGFEGVQAISVQPTSLARAEHRAAAVKVISMRAAVV
jgi:methyl-accepting chemotaxis protein